MSFFGPTHLTFALRVQGPWAGVWQCPSLQCMARAIQWVIVTTTDGCHGEETWEPSVGGGVRRCWQVLQLRQENDVLTWLLGSF